MDQPVTFQLHDTLQPLKPAEWAELYADHPDSAELISLMSRVPLDGFVFRSIVGRIDGKPVVLVPLFETRYSLATSLEGDARKFLHALEKFAPAVLQPRVIGVGFVEGEWGAVGISPHLSAAAAQAVLNGVIDYLHETATRLGVDIIAFKDFHADSFKRLPNSVKAKFAAASSLPFCQMDITFNDVEGYLQTLPRKVRQDLRRKLRQSSAVRVEYTANPDKWLDRIYKLYVEQVERSDLSFGCHKREFFAEVCRTVPGAQYILFFDGEQLIGFNLIVDRGDMLVDKYVGMDPVAGRAHNIYFLAFIEKIRYCTARGIKRLHLGAAAEGVKVRMGAQALPTYVLFWHRRPLINMALVKVAPLLAYKPDSHCELPEPASMCGFGAGEQVCTLRAF